MDHFCNGLKNCEIASSLSVGKIKLQYTNRRHSRKTKTAKNNTIGLHRVFPCAMHHTLCCTSIDIALCAYTLYTAYT